MTDSITTVERRWRGALAALQALYRESLAKENRIHDLEHRLELLEKRLDTIENGGQ